MNTDKYRLATKAPDKLHAPGYTLQALKHETCSVGHKKSLVLVFFVSLWLSVSELQAINEEVAMRVKYFIVGLLIIFVLSQTALGEPGKCLDKMMEVRRDIQFLNLINGLELDREQIKFIVQKAADAEKIREEFRRQLEKKEAETIQIFKELREKLREGEEISPLLRRQVRRANSSKKNLERDYEKRIAALALDVQERLYGYQLHILDQYRPCLIPPAGGSSAGQVKNSKGAEKQLTRIRNMPDAIFARRQEKLVRRIIERIRRTLPRGFIVEEEEEKKRILSVINEARNLSDLDFALKKTELAQELKSEHALPQRSISLSVKTERLLLTSRVIPLLKNRLAAK